MRHGETLSNIAEIYQGQGNGQLSKNGIAQAKATAKYLSDTKIDVIYSSSLDRSYETASIVAKPHKLKVTKVPDLKERYYGEWEGLKFNIIARKYKELYKLWLKDPNLALIPGAEKLLDLQKRGVDAVEKIVKKHKNRTILIVGHGGINRTVLFHYIGVDLNHFWKIRQNNCCINIIEFRKPYPRVALINSTSHLSKTLLKTNALT